MIFLGTARHGTARLGTKTNLNLLSECERKRHEAVTEKMAHRVALLGRTSSSLGQEISKQLTQ